MNSARTVGVFIVATLVGCGGDQSAEPPLAGGLTTVDEASSHAFMQPASNLDDAAMDLHLAGDVAFEAKFVTAPAPVNAGLGPLFNNNSCNACHLRNGRGVPAVGGQGLRSHMLVRVSEADGEQPREAGNVPTAEFGDQIQDHGVFGVEPEAIVEITWTEIPGQFADGEPYSLRKPVVKLTRPDGSLVEGILTSLRQAPPVFGLGLLEAVPAQTLIELEDPDDKNDDGISGRVNHVWSNQLQDFVVGRFGWKSNQPDLYQQSASAYRGDMGVGSPGYPDAEGNIEIETEIVEAAAFYARSLGVPKQRGFAGREQFRAAGCDACHVEKLSTGFSEFEFLANQEFAPFSDLLLHDMGEGLADGRGDFLASGTEWRTAPLWGIGLTQTVAPGATYLHDGRARTLAEAILWHGGEGEKSKERFRNMSKPDRDALLDFLQNL